LGIDSTVRICQKIYPEIATYFSSADSRPWPQHSAISSQSKSGVDGKYSFCSCACTVLPADSRRRLLYVSTKLVCTINANIHHIFRVAHTWLSTLIIMALPFRYYSLSWSRRSLCVGVMVKIFSKIPKY
jgi:hypothetical protein